MRRYRALLLGIALLAARPAAAGIELAGTTGANFLTIGPGASIVGLGGAGMAGYSDLAGMSWNPASLGFMQESQLMFTHMPLAGSASQEWMAFGGRMGVAPTRWALSGRYEGDGSFEARDPLGNPTGTFNSSSLALGVNAARPLDRHTVVGMGAKFVNENLGSVSGYGGTFDMGVVYHAGPLSLGAAAQNMGGSMKYDSLAYSMPLNFGAGIALAHARSGLRIAVDINHPNAYYDDVRTGAEWLWKDHMALRVGYRKELKAPTDDPMNGTSFGLGLGGRGLWFDYGYVIAGDGSSQQRISLRVSPKDWGLNFGTDLDTPPGAAPGQSSPPVASQPPASAPTPAPASSSASTPAASTTTTSTSAGSAATTSSASAAPVATSTTTAPAKPPAPAPAAIAPVPAAVAPAPIAPAPATTSASSTTVTKPAAPEPVAPSPELTTLVPVTPPAVPTPKPVASRPASLPTVSAPAPQGKPSEAPVTESATDGSDDTASATEVAPAKPAKPVKGKPAVTTTAAAAAVVTPAPAAKPGKPVTRPTKIHVKKGETLESIAKLYNTTAAAIMMDNNLVTEKVKPGQELKIPDHQ